MGGPKHKKKTQLFIRKLRLFEVQNVKTRQVNFAPDKETLLQASKLLTRQVNFAPDK